MPVQEIPRSISCAASREALGEAVVPKGRTAELCGEVTGLVQGLGETVAVMAKRAGEPCCFTDFLKCCWEEGAWIPSSDTESRGLSEDVDISLAQAWKEYFLSDIRRWEVSRIGCLQISSLCDASCELSACSGLSLPSCTSCSCELYTSDEILLMSSRYPRKLSGPLDEYFCPKSYSHPSVWKGFSAERNTWRLGRCFVFFQILQAPSFLFLFCPTSLSGLFLLVFTVVSFLAMDSQEKQALLFCVSAVDKSGDSEGRPQLCAWFSSWLSCHVEESFAFWIKSVLSH